MKRRNYIWFFGVLTSMLLLATGGCTQDVPLDQPYILSIPAGFPEMDIPEDNQLTEKRVELGKMLFFDKRLSLDSSLSCGSCHLQELAFTDGLAFSNGFAGRKSIRNSPSLGNIGYHPYFFRDGGVPTLELQILAPIEDPNEMNNEPLVALERVRYDPVYVRLALEAYNRPFDMFVLTRAIAAFERTLITGNSRFDQYEYRDDKTALTESEIRGRALFFSERLSCSDCHSGFNLTNYEFLNNGLYQEYTDSGRTRINLKPEDRGKFKVASLRNIGVTAPYMHDGSLTTLESVIEHYNSGGKNHVNQDERIQPLNLTQQEKEDLKNFLLTLTDETFITKNDLIQ